MATARPIRDRKLEVSNLPAHLQGNDNKNWLISFQLDAISAEGKTALLKIWRRLEGRIIETTIELEETETLTFIDGDAQ